MIYRETSRHSTIATVSGSFRKAMREVQEAVYALTDAGVRVLSPADPRVVDQLDSFLFVASDRLRVIRLVQERHLECIAASDLLWLVSPDGYIGTSAALEIGYAVAKGVPVFSQHAPADATAREFVTVVKDLNGALEEVRYRNKPRRRPGLLVDPAATIEAARVRLDVTESLLVMGKKTSTARQAARAAADVVANA